MPERVYLCDSDSVAPGSETDRPQHCSYCHCPLFMGKEAVLREWTALQLYMYFNAWYVERR